MQANITLGLFLGIGIVCIFGNELLGQNTRPRGQSKAGQEIKKSKKDSGKTREKTRQPRGAVKDTYKKSTAALIEKTKKPQEVTWERGRLTSTFSSDAKELKSNQNFSTLGKNILRNDLLNQNKIPMGQRLGAGGKRPFSQPNQPAAQGIRSKRNTPFFKKHEKEARYMDSLLRISDRRNKQETASLSQGPPYWADQDMMGASKTSGNQLTRVRSDKTWQQLEDTINRYFPARKILMIAQKKEEASPADFVNLIGGKKETKNLPSHEGEAKSAMLQEVKEEARDIGSYRLSEEHLAALKTLQARQPSNLPQALWDSARRAALRKNRIKLKEVSKSKTEKTTKIQERRRLLHRFFFEGIMGGFNKDFTTFQISPSLGFKAFRNFSVGVGPMLSVSRATRWSVACDVRLLVRREFFRQRSYLQLEDIMHPYSRDKGYSIKQAFYVGAGYVWPIGQMASLNLLGMYQVGGAKTGQPLLFRVGLSIINKAKNE